VFKSDCPRCNLSSFDPSTLDSAAVEHLRKTIKSATRSTITPR